MSRTLSLCFAAGALGGLARAFALWMLARLGVLSALAASTTTGVSAPSPTPSMPRPCQYGSAT